MSSKVTFSKDLKTIHANYDKIEDWEMDPKGYFLIRINPETKEIEAGFCKKSNIIEIKIVGKNAQEIFNTIIREELVSLQQHAADLGAELQKAEIALQLNIPYIQDSPLDLSQTKNE